MNIKTITHQPNLFIAGAPKCGTTSLYDYLICYPEVGEGILKEPHFFNDDHDEYRHAKSLDQYLAFYDSSCRANHSYLIDASTNYIYSNTAVDRILNFEPGAKIIIMLRNPVDLIRSLHAHFVFKQSETESDLSRAWELGPLRERAPDFVKKSPYPGHLSYKIAGSLGKHLAPIVQRVPSNNLFLIFFEDFVDKTETVLGQLLKFLEIEEIKSVQLEKRNRSRLTRSKMLNRLLFYPPPPVRYLKQIVKKIVPPNTVRQLELYGRISRTKKASYEMPPTLKQSMQDYFKDDIGLLSELTERNLDHWLEN